MSQRSAGEQLYRVTRKIGWTYIGGYLLPAVMSLAVASYRIDTTFRPLVP